MILWKKSSLSSDTFNCVEVAVMTDHVLVRNSKDPNGPVLNFRHAEWDAFIAGAQAGEFTRDSHSDR